MAILPVSLARVSSLLSSDVTSQQINSLNSQLLDVQNELSTGKKINLPSDDPADASTAMQITKTINDRASYTANLSAANNQLSEVDSTLSDVETLVTQAQTIASQNAGTDVTADARKAASAVVDSLYNQALSLANKQFEGTYLFGGDTADAAPYTSSADGVTYTGTGDVITNTWDESYTASLQVNGQSVFSSGDSSVGGSVDLTPTISTNTRLSDLRGAAGNGVTLGSIVISNGSVSKTVDLSQAQSIGDVINLVNAAGVPGFTMDVDPAGQALQVLSSGGARISINEAGNGTTAADLGILQTSPYAANSGFTGHNPEANVTDLTPLSALAGGAGISSAGFVISNGTTSATISMSGLNTVQDLLNKINGAGVGVQAAISSDGKGITVTNVTQGTTMSIDENGGTTATQLGLRTTTGSTLLSSLNNGKGVGVVDGTDIQINRRNGTSFQVDLSSAKTVQDVINDINSADAGGGVTASLKTTGNGIQLTDSTTGSTAFGVTSVNFSTAAKDLGLDATASGGTISGTDTGGLTAGGLFADLKNLRDALANNDTGGITSAAEGLTADGTQVTDVRGANGATLQEITSRQDRISDENTASESLLSDLTDADYTTVVTQYQTLQTAMEAALKAGSISLNMSLMDFLS